MADEEKNPEAQAAAPASDKPSKGLNPWIPVAAVALLCPLLSFVVIQFLILPKIEKSIDAVAAKIESSKEGSDEEGAIISKASAPVTPKKEVAKKEPAKKESHEKKGEGGEGGSAGNSYEFKNIVSNISGALQSRYVKVSFTIEGDDPELAEKVAANKSKMIDATLSLLSALTLNDLEQPGIKNVLRSDLLSAFEAILHERSAKELYFSEFVVQ